MIATALLRDEHDAVRALFARLEKEHGAERRLERLRKVAHEAA